VFKAQISILRTIPILSRWYKEGRSRSKVIIPPPTIVTSRLIAGAVTVTLPPSGIKGDWHKEQGYYEFVRKVSNRLSRFWPLELFTQLRKVTLDNAIRGTRVLIACR
jgi:hypothetical protein